MPGRPKPADGQWTQTGQRAASSAKHTQPLPSHPVQSAQPARRLLQTGAGFKPSGFWLMEPEALGPDCYYCNFFFFYGGLGANLYPAALSPMMHTLD